MDEQPPQMIATFADRPEVAALAAGALARGEAERAGEMAGAGEAVRVADEGDQRGELALDLTQAAFEFPDFLQH